MQRIPDLPDAGDAAGPADDRGVLPDQLPGILERVSRPEHFPAVAGEADVAGGVEPVSRRLRAALRRVSGWHAHRHPSAGAAVPGAAARIYQWADQWRGEAVNRSTANGPSDCE